MIHISIYCAFYFWSEGFALWCKSIFFDLFWSVKLNKGFYFLQSAFWIWITKLFSLVRECNVFLQCCITLSLILRRRRSLAVPSLPSLRELRVGTANDFGRLRIRLYHPGPSSWVFFAGCWIITDNDLQIQNYKNEVQLKLKLHQLGRIALCLSILQLCDSLKIMWVF